MYETPQANQQGAQGAQAGIPSGLANDYPSAPGVANVPLGGNYPAAGRPAINAAPSFGGSTAGIPSTAYGVPSTSASAPGNYQPSGPTGSNYPAATAVGSTGNYPASQFPSTQGPYPSGPNVPSTGYQPPQAYPSQSDTPYPPSAATPPRDYLPPRRG